jgi:hypothetical protein
MRLFLNPLKLSKQKLLRVLYFFYISFFQVSFILLLDKMFIYGMVDG